MMRDRTTEDRLIQFSPERSIQQTFLLIRPWNHYDFELPDFADKTQSMDDFTEPGSPSDDPIGTIDRLETMGRLIRRLIRQSLALEAF